MRTIKDYDLKLLNFTFCGGRAQDNDLLFLFLNWIQSVRTQFQKNYPTFDEMNEMEYARLNLKQREHTS